jgi:hypothetical protein
MYVYIIACLLKYIIFIMYVKIDFHNITETIITSFISDKVVYFGVMTLLR